MTHPHAGLPRILFANASSVANPLLRILVTRLEGRVQFLACTFDAPGPLDEQLADLGVPLVHLPPASPRDLPRAAVALRAHLRTTTVDLVHANLLWPGVATELARLAPGAPPSVFTRHHDRSHHVLGKRIHVRADRWTARRAGAVIAPSRAVADTLVRVEGVPADRVTVVHHGIEWDRLVVDDRSRAQWRSRFAGRQLAVAVGRLDPIKAYPDLLDALRHARAAVPNLHLAIAGTGRPGARSELEARVEAMGLTEAVTFLGHVDGIASLLAAADVFVQASRAESFGLATLEAAGHGVPLAVTTPGGIAEIVEGVAAPLAPGDPAALGRRIVEVVTTPSRTDAARSGAADVRARFSPERMADGHLAVYASVMARAARSS